MATSQVIALNYSSRINLFMLKLWTVVRHRQISNSTLVQTLLRLFCVYFLYDFTYTMLFCIEINIVLQVINTISIGYQAASNSAGNI